MKNKDKMEREIVRKVELRHGRDSIPNKVGLRVPDAHSAYSATFNPPDKKCCLINPLRNSGRRNTEPVCEHPGTFHENNSNPEAFF